MEEKYKTFDDFKEYEFRIKLFNNIKDRFWKLDEKDRQKILDILQESLDNIEKENLKKKEECELKGHEFSKWISGYKYAPVNPLESVIIDIRYSVYERTCNRCGYKEVSKSKPKELKLIIEDNCK